MDGITRDYALDIPLHMHPEDAARPGLGECDEMKVRSHYGEVVAVLALDDALRPRVVAMTRGWGHGAGPELEVAHNHPGVNVGALPHIGLGGCRPLSNQAHMTDIPVSTTARPEQPAALGAGRNANLPPA